MILPNILKVDGEPGLVRDTASNAILSTDIKAKQEFKERQKRQLNIMTMDTRLKVVENDLSEIKSMLKTLLNKQVSDNNLKE